MRILLAFPVAALILSGQTLTVEQGFAGPTPRPGGVAHVFARPNSSTQVFDRWTGDVQYLLDTGAPVTTLVMPEANVRLRANYRTVPAWTPRTGTFQNIPVTYYVPANPVGMVFVFHGTGGSGTGQFTGMEFLSWMRDLVAAGFGVAAFDCENRTTGQWNTTVADRTNPDIVRLNGVIDAMRQQGVIGASLPLFAFGHSNGGQFSHVSSLVMNWRAIAISAVQGSEPAANGYNGPVLWWVPKNDDHPQVGPAGVATSIRRYEIAANRGMAVQHIVHGPSPLYAERFARSAVITEADSREVFQLFRDRGWLDDGGLLRRNPNEDYWLPSMPARFTETMRAGVRVQLETSYATHEWYNAAPHLIIDHFLRALESRPAVRPVNGASFAATNLTAGMIASLFVPALADRLAIGANGPEASLRGVSAVLRSGTGTETPVRWFFVAQNQGSFLTPDNLAAGGYTLKIQSGDRRWSIPTTIAAAAPGIFTANGNGQGVPAAVILRVAPDNTRRVDYPFAAAAGGGFEAAPLRFGNDRLFLDLYATGVRGASVQVRIGDETIVPLYSGAQPQFAGLDQVTFELPRSFAGKGKVPVVIVAGGERSNTVELNFGN